MSRILVINPNSSAVVTAAIERSVAPLRMAGGPLIEVRGLASGPVGIASQQDADSVVPALVEWVARDQADAFVLACFSDPGIHAVREAALGRPVMGIAEWGVLRALTLGERFGIIALSPSSIRRQQRYVRQIGVQDRYAGSWPVHAMAADTAGPAMLDRLAEAGSQLVAACRADVVVLGCAGMALHRQALEQRLGVPVIEPVQQAVGAAVTAVMLRASDHSAATA